MAVLVVPRAPQPNSKFRDRHLNPKSEGWASTNSHIRPDLLNSFDHLAVPTSTPNPANTSLDTGLNFSLRSAFGTPPRQHTGKSFFCTIFRMAREVQCSSM